VSTLAERVKWCVETSSHSSERAFARAAGLGSTYISYLVRGQRGKRLSAEVAKKIAGARGVSWRWVMTGEGPRDAAMASDEDARGLGVELAEELRDTMDEVLLALGDHLDETEKRLARARAHKSKEPLAWDECLAVVQQVRRDVQRARDSVPRPNLPQPTPNEDRLALGAMAEHLKRRLKEGATLEQVVGELGGGASAGLLPAAIFEPGAAKAEALRQVPKSGREKPAAKSGGSRRAGAPKKATRPSLVEPRTKPARAVVRRVLPPARLDERPTPTAVGEADALERGGQGVAFDETAQLVVRRQHEGRAERAERFDARRRDEREEVAGRLAVAAGQARLRCSELGGERGEVAAVTPERVEEDRLGGDEGGGDAVGERFASVASHAELVEPVGGELAGKEEALGLGGETGAHVNFPAA
jgi:transcriptional regulator with XRE-family HTH domain